MVVEIKEEGKFFVVYHNDKEISRKSTLLRATKALVAYAKGHQHDN